jgi:putative endonuclease
VGFFVYIVECADASFYVGSTNDLKKRIRQHNGAKSGAKYTSGRRPVVLRYSESCTTYAKVRAREGELKRLTRAQKLTLIHSGGAKTRATISGLSALSNAMGKGDNSQQREKKKPKKDKDKKK